MAINIQSTVTPRMLDENFVITAPALTMAAVGARPSADNLLTTKLYMFLITFSVVGDLVSPMKHDGVV